MCFFHYFCLVSSKMEIKNKKAEYQYFLFEHFTAGIQLQGTEIKSIRVGKVSLAESYCLFKDNELYVRNMHISEYKFGTYDNHEPKRDRKLLLTKREIKKLLNKTNEKGFTIIPVCLFISENGLAKLEIALAKGKKFYDKRDSIKDKDQKRDLQKKLKNY